MQETLIHFTSILYLKKPSKGGNLAFESGAQIEPLEGRLVVFTSGAENRHWVEEVTKGHRVALTLFWSCDRDYSIESSV